MKTKPRQYTYDEWIKRHPEVLEEEEEEGINPREIYERLCREELTRWKDWRKELGKK
jgi:hypothetical protein